ncbi:cilia- and flagella-associated protein 65 isoform X2 [Melanotaenia boesemani]|uniref:cilia- and flagella-associated protein 65 isoform X2 n=1 Tax=Melanotaenia boesemani TaxID=1250792 RepID=UPI001C04581E|nr:cilia- and flagella-associated protein 65 isoform X2 [Melanotaenia boesemani]
MLAEARDPDPLASVAPWKPPIAEKDRKDPGIHSRRRGLRYQRQASNQKSCFFGVETTPKLVWEDWDLGREFTKTLVLKNVYSKMQKLHIRSPVSKFFSISIPQTAYLSPGTSLSIPVIFRPLKRCEYDDIIEFQGGKGNFQIRLHAIPPCPTLEVPESVMLPLCAVQHSSQTHFQLKNVSKLKAFFQWDCPAQFQLYPEQGLLKPGQECHITVIFRPQEALVYQQQAYCRFGEEGNNPDSLCAVLLQGLAKYPYLQLRNSSGKEEEDHGDPVLHFGSVGVGQSLCKHFEIFNPSPVNVSFCLSCLPAVAPMYESEFSCDVSRGEVAPGESLQVLVTYFPAVVDAVSVEYLTLKYSGSISETRLKLIGKCIGPKVSLSSSVVDFGCVEERRSAVKTVELFNSSHVEAIYQWDIDCANSVFSILPANGTVPAQSHITLRAVYTPTHPMGHHRRVACLTLHREPVFLDLIGTCHSELQQPAILKPEHLVLYKLHWIHRQHSSDSVSALQQGHDANVDQEREHLFVEKQSNKKTYSGAAISTTPMEEFYQVCSGCVDPPSSSSLSSSPHVSIVPSELLFNHKMTSSSFTSSASQSVSITNHTTGKLSLIWTVTQKSSFSISPSSCVLAPLKSTSFQVTYVPKQLNTLHGAQLECFAYYKDSPDKRQQLLCLPWCVTVRVIGHSFQLGKEHFTPICSLKPHQVVFPALGGVFYRTVLLKNNGDLPLTFCQDHGSNCPLAESMPILPSCGVVPPGNHQILTLRAIPTEDSPKQGLSVTLQLNAAKFTKELTVISVVEKPHVFLESGSSLYFHPTAVGSQTQCSHHIRNLSRLPLRFQWSIPESDQELISVKPDAGELHPNESSVQIWSFSPLSEKMYTIKPTLTFWPLQSDESNKSHLTIEVVGMGSKGFIEAEKAVLDFGDTLIGSCRSFEVPLVNNSPCPVSFHLSVQQMLTDTCPSYDSETEQSALQLDFERGNIASRSTMLLRSTFRPCRQAQYVWTFSYQTLNTSGFVSCPPQALCEVRAKAVFPTLQVIDGYSCGSVGRVSKVHLWKLFSLESLNDHLLCSPSPTELTFRTPTKHSLRSCPSTFTKAIVDFNFSSAALNSDPTHFLLMLHNPGSVPVDWAFLFPEDQQIELEYWSVTGEFSSNELCQMKVQDNQLFRVSPRSGTLLPGQKRAVNFSYSHDFVGTDRLPVVLKLSHGREILLNFQGMTAEKEKTHLHFASTQHVFTSVAIGDCSPPRQIYELHSGGGVPVHYEVDTAALEQLQVDNFNHPVLRCLNPKGEILPGKTALLEWIFSPLEAKMYHMDVPINIQDSEPTLLRFDGCGLDSPTLGSSKIYASNSKTTVHCVQKVPFPGQLLFLSEDSIFLGNIPVCSPSSRILFLTNVSHTDTVQYLWELPQHGYQQVVQIYPEQGRLHPGECDLCVLTFTPSDYPTIYQLDLVCQVTAEAALARYHKALHHWEEEKQKQQDEFTITDKKLPERRVFIDKQPVAAPARKGPPLRKYKTLPPICSSSSSETVGSLYTRQTRTEQQLQREKAKEWRRPEAPQPALLHLNITAHSYGLLEYLTHFPDQYNKLLRNLPLNRTQQCLRNSASTSLSAGPSVSIHNSERDILQNTITPLLRDILDDSAFIKSLTLCYKPAIYRPTQISSTNSRNIPTPPCSPTQPISCSTSTPQPNGIVERKEAAGCSENKPRMQTTLKSKHAPADVCQVILMNTFQNLMMEAVRGELVLTAHPHTVTPPPLAVSRQMSRAVTDEDQQTLKSHNPPK